MKTHPSILNGKITSSGGTGDGKRIFFECDPDEWEALRGEIDTDDCDSKHAKEWLNRIIKCVNACRGIENPSVTENRKS